MMAMLANFGIEQWASLATVIGVPFATLALVLGYIQYRASIEAAALAHVNGLFRDLLRLEFDFYNAPGSDHTERARERLLSYRMWVLEEMWLWLHEQRRPGCWTTVAQKQRRAFYASWLNTLRHHAKRNTAEEWKQFGRTKACYDPHFGRFVLRFRPRERANR